VPTLVYLQLGTFQHEVTGKAYQWVLYNGVHLDISNIGWTRNVLKNCMNDSNGAVTYSPYMPHSLVPWREQPDVLGKENLLIDFKPLAITPLLVLINYFL
jgi:hypothetical protein